MPITAVCPGCSARVTAPDAAAGKKVRCPKCEAAVPVPAAEADEGFEVVDAPAPKSAKKRPVVVEDDEPEEDERPKKKRPREERDEGDEDERPKRKRHRDADEDEEDERPRKRRRSRDDDDDDDEEKGGVSLARNLIMGGVLVVLVAVAGYVFYTKYQEPDDGTKKSDPKLVGPGDDNLKRAGIGAAK